MVLLPLDEDVPRSSAASPSASPSATPTFGSGRLGQLPLSQSNALLSVRPFLTQSMSISLTHQEGAVPIAVGNTPNYHDVLVFPYQIEGKCEFPTVSPKQMLPQLPSHFITRPKEMKAVVEDLLNSHNRVVNLTGSLGVGKNTLTLAVGHFLAERKIFGDGVFFVELNNLRSQNIMCYTVARSFGLSVNTPEELFAELQNKAQCLVIMKVRTPLGVEGLGSSSGEKQSSSSKGQRRTSSGSTSSSDADNASSFTELHLFLKELLRKTKRGFKVLISSRQPLDFSATLRPPSPPIKDADTAEPLNDANDEDEDDDVLRPVLGMDEFGLKRIYDVGSFSRQHSRMLLKSIAPHLGKFSKDISQMFGHLPLALKLVARYSIHS